MTALLSDFRIRIGACVLALALAGGVGVVTKPKAARMRTAGVEEPTRTVVPTRQ